MRVNGIDFRCLGTEVSLGNIHASIYVCIRRPAYDELRISSDLMRGWVLFDDWSLSLCVSFPSKFSGLICISQWPTKRCRPGTYIRTFGKKVRSRSPEMLYDLGDRDIRMPSAYQHSGEGEKRTRLFRLSGTEGFQRDRTNPLLDSTTRSIQ